MQPEKTQAGTAPRKRKKHGNILVWVLVLLLLGGMVFAGWQLFKIFWGYKKDRDAFDDLAEQVIITQPVQETPEATPVPWPTIDWQALQAVNPEVVGWLYCPDTIINYPVMQTTDNDFYLHHATDKSYNISGSLFADYETVLGQPLYNYTIYGHYMKDGSMFQSLSNYVDQEYYEEHPILYFLTPDTAYRVELLCGGVVESEADNYPVSFADEQAYRQYIDNAMAHSAFVSHAEVDTQYQLMSLSTCNYTRSLNNPRMLLHGLMIPVG